MSTIWGGCCSPLLCMCRAQLDELYVPYRESFPRACMSLDSQNRSIISLCTLAPYWCSCVRGLNSVPLRSMLPIPFPTRSCSNDISSLGGWTWTMNVPSVLTFCNLLYGNGMNEWWTASSVWERQFREVMRYLLCRFQEHLFGYFLYQFHNTINCSIIYITGTSSSVALKQISIPLNCHFPPSSSGARPGAVPRRLASDRVPQQHPGREALEEGNDLRGPGRPLRGPRQPPKVFRGQVRPDRGAGNLLRFRHGHLLNGESEWMNRQSTHQGRAKCWKDSRIMERGRAYLTHWSLGVGQHKCIAQRLVLLVREGRCLVYGFLGLSLKLIPEISDFWQTPSVISSWYIILGYVFFSY